MPGNINWFLFSTGAAFAQGHENPMHKRPITNPKKRYFRRDAITVLK